MAQNTGDVEIDSVASNFEKLSVGKSPAMILHEFADKIGAIDKYEVVQVEGSVHFPKFTVRVVLDSKMADGCGSSKKIAKQAAAKAMIEQIGADEVENAIKKKKKNATDGVQVTDETRDISDLGESNPISKLQEVCMIKKIQTPTYETTEQTGETEQLFVMKCTLGHMVTCASGRSKKLAKRLAAAKMLANFGIDVDSNDDNDNLEGDKKRLDNLMAKCEALMCKKSCLVGLQDPEIFPFAMEAESVRFLDAISNEQNFETVYVELGEKMYQGPKCHCLVQMFLSPVVAVCSGSGETMASAKINAAANALQYLKIVTK